MVIEIEYNGVISMSNDVPSKSYALTTGSYKFIDQTNDISVVYNDGFGNEEQPTYDCAYEYLDPLSGQYTTALPSWVTDGTCELSLD